MHLKRLFAVAAVCAALIVGQPFAAELEDDFEWDESEWVNHVPALSYWGLRGLPQTMSAEPLGMGRFNVSLFAGYFKQEQDIRGLFRGQFVGSDGLPGKDENIVTSRVLISYGVDENISIFGTLPVPSWYWIGSSTNWAQIMGGLHYSFPIPEYIRFRVALNMSLLFGMRSDASADAQITTNPAYVRDHGYGGDEYNKTDMGGDPHHIPWSYAGYDYFEARKRDHMDLVVKVPLSFLFADAVKLHYNPGLAITPFSEQHLFLNALGLQIDPMDYLTFGVELNSRTVFQDIDFMHDPLWLTASIMGRSKYGMRGIVGFSGTFGVDIRLSQAKTYDWWEHSGERVIDNITRNVYSRRSEEVYPLESWRIFGDVVLSLDFVASKRMEMEREARRNAAEKARLRRQASLSEAQRDSIARQAREDSLRMATEAAERAHADSIRAQHIADSLAAEMGDLTERARQDSIAQAQAAAQREAELAAQSAAQRAADSLALLEAQKRLEEERAKRSEAEQMLLSTGMIVLDAVYFETGKAIIHRNSIPYLRTIAKMLAKYPKLRIEVGGHTDITGSLETNMRLSQQRADAVFSFMAQEEPALAQMLSAKGYGPTVPKADNNTAAGRETNRRVELKVLNPEVLQEYNP